MKKSKVLPPVLRRGQKVFFPLLEKGSHRTEWHVGEFEELLPPKKGGETPLCRVSPYQIPELMEAHGTSEEWTSESAPIIPLFPPRVAKALVVLERLESHAGLVWKKLPSIDLLLAEVRPLTRDAYLASVLKSESR